MGALSMRTQQLPFALAAVLAHALVACLGSAASPVASGIIPEEDWAPSVSELELVQQNWVDCVSRAPEAKTKCLAKWRISNNPDEEEAAAPAPPSGPSELSVKQAAAASV